MPTRGKSDHLGLEGERALADDLSAYVTRAGSADNLWKFGSYGNDDCTPSMAPRIDELLQNKELWSIMLKHFPKGKMTDSNVVAAMETVMGRVNFVNNRSFNDKLFVTWFVKCCHLSVSHLRDLSTYTTKYAYRISKLDAQEHADLFHLLGMIQKPIIPQGSQSTRSISPTSPPKKKAKPSVTELLHKFLPTSTTQPAPDLLHKTLPTSSTQPAHPSPQGQISAKLIKIDIF